MMGRNVTGSALFRRSPKLDEWAIWGGFRQPLRNWIGVDCSLVLVHPTFWPAIGTKSSAQLVKMFQ